MDASIELKDDDEEKPRTSNVWSLYILECGDGSWYTGITNNLERRLKSHSLGKGGKYTRAHLPIRLIYHEMCSSRREALIREIKVKSLNRQGKVRLVSDCCLSKKGGTSNISTKN